MKNTSFARSFLTNIIFPTLLAIVLFIVAIFFIIIPSSENHLRDRKREMIRELTNSVWNLLDSYNNKVITGELELADAQKKSIADIQSLRYGPENKDYFWITDMHPRMIVHPYRGELNGQDLSSLTDSHGKKLFVEFVNTVRKDNSGYVDYWWQWKDDSTRIVLKLSYVRLFEPWEWVIGTGIYIEDVRIEISHITKKLIHISIAIIFILAFILSYTARQTFLIEQRKQSAEKELAESREKYKKLVEASTEGTLLIMDSRVIYTNPIIRNMLGFTDAEFIRMNINELFKLDDKNGSESKDFFSLLDSGDISNQFEALLLSKEGSFIEALVSISRINILGKNGFIVIVKDMSGLKKIKEELGTSKQKFQMLTDNINIGVFRVQLDNNHQFVELNSAGENILGIKKENLASISFIDIFRSKEEAQIFISDLLAEGSINKRIVQINKTNKVKAVVSISAVIIKAEYLSDKFIDGIIEDISERMKTEQAREDIIAGLQTSLVYLNQPVKHFSRKCLRIPLNTTIQRAARDIKKHNHSAALVVSESDQVIGIVTAQDLWQRVVCDDFDVNLPLFRIMTAPVISLSENAFVFEALMLMQEQLVRDLPLYDSNGNIISMITEKEILHLAQYSAGFLVQEINRAESVDVLLERCKTLPQMVKYLVENGLYAAHITRIISLVGDVVAVKFIRFAIEAMGEPPVKFAFLLLGSQGREEQTLVTDQDNIIIYENTQLDVKDYFQKLAEMVNGWLDQAGYHFCKGDVMAKNPKWCVCLDEWKKHFSHWINEANPQDLVDINIFFDFRTVFGEGNLTKELRLYVEEIAQNKFAFFNHLAKNSLLIRPPVTFTGNIKKSSGERHEAFDIKHALMPIIDFARIYSLRHNVSERNTLQRLEKLYEMNIITRASYDEIVECYNYLMTLRLQHQVQDMMENKLLNNYINPKKITQIEQHMLKKIFSQIGDFQKRLSFDFTGIA